MMYLEISPRQTGKSTRLKKAMQHHIIDGGTAILMVKTHYMGRIVCDALSDEMVQRINYFTEIEHLHKYMTVRNDNSDLKVFYDEFDFMNPADVSIIQTGYYVTTPNKLRKLGDVVAHETGLTFDPLLALVDINDCYTTYLNYNISTDKSIASMAAYKNMLSADQYKSEIQGQFLDI